jgi:hypothetical protein
LHVLAVVALHFDELGRQIYPSTRSNLPARNPARLWAFLQTVQR